MNQTNKLYFYNFLAEGRIENDQQKVDVINWACAQLRDGDQKDANQFLMDLIQTWKSGYGPTEVAVNSALKLALGQLLIGHFMYIRRK